MRAVIICVILKLSCLRVTSEDCKTFEKESVNVRTVLFKEMDSCKTCWSRDEVNLLLARRLMQDLLPRRAPKNFSMVLKYMRGSVETLKTRTPPADLSVMTRAMFDVFGGYLKAIVIPMVNEAYYAGNIDYDVTADLHGLMGEMMAYLGTNGEPWSTPCDMRRLPTKVAALPVTICKHEESCNALLIRSDEGGGKSECTGEIESKIPLPFLDDNSYPNAIAIPFKDHSLFSLMTRCSSNLLPKYYIVAMRCLTSPQYDKQDIITFNHQLHHWIVAHTVFLVRQVVPHLHETVRWYPGFGGVMRIIETMNQRGLASGDEIKPDMTSNNGTALLDGVEMSSSDHFPWWIILLVLVICIALFLCCCLLVCCCAARKKREKEEDVDDLDGRMISAITNIYVGNKDSVKRLRSAVSSGGSSDRRSRGKSSDSLSGEESTVDSKSKRGKPQQRSRKSKSESIPTRDSSSPG